MKKLAALLAASALLVACSSDTDGEPRDVPPQVSPHGDPGVWMHDSYADGIFGVFAVPGIVCGISGDYLIQHDSQVRIDSSVRAWNIHTGDVVWEIEGAACSRNSVIDEEVIIGRGELMDRHWLGRRVGTVSITTCRTRTRSTSP